MSAPFQPGDVVVCVDATDIFCGVTTHLCLFFKKGDVVRVCSVAPSPTHRPECPCECQSVATIDGRSAIAARFRKIDAGVTEEFRSILRKLLAKVKA